VFTPGINEDDISTGGFNADAGVSQPGDLETLKIHRVPLRPLIVNELTAK
jgi:hypothetical protein